MPVNTTQTDGKQDMNLSFTRSRTVAVLLGAGALAVAGTTGAVASSMVTSHDIANHTIQAQDMATGSVTHRVIQDGAVHSRDLSAGLWAHVQKGGPKGDNGLAGAYYSVAYYDVGDTNASAIATVACKNETDTAISGGVQVLGLDAGANSRNTPVSSSFPGRMDWTTNSPKANRLDGWIVQFGGTDNAPEKTKIWALCVPNLDLPVVQTYTESK